MSSNNTGITTIVNSLDGYLTGRIVARESGDALIRQLSILFSIAAESCEAHDIETFDRVFSRLIEDAAVDTRGFLSIQLAAAPRAPATTIRRLAADVIEVARPILVHSPHLDDADLIRIAVQTGLAHMAAIAERAELTVTVTDVLVTSGDDEVRRKLAGNHGARLSNRSFRRLSDQARVDPGLEEALVGREDVPDIVIRFLVRHGPGRARERLGGAVAPGDGSEAREPAPARSAEAWAALYDFDAAEARVAAFAEQGLRGEPLLMRMVAEERFPEAAILAARLVGVRQADMIAWLTAADPGLFLAAAKTLPLQPRTVYGLLNIGPWRQMLDGRQRQEAVRHYLALDAEAAALRLAAWRREAGRRQGVGTTPVF